MSLLRKITGKDDTCFFFIYFKIEKGTYLPVVDTSLMINTSLVNLPDWMIMLTNPSYKHEENQ